MSANVKRNYRIQFNWHYEIYTFYKYAHSKKQAKRLCWDELSTRLGLSKRAVQMYFDGSKDNVSIKEVA
jgi:hypothetical protein